jgi:hypothetical protein
VRRYSQNLTRKLLAYPLWPNKLNIMPPIRHSTVVSYPYYTLLATKSDARNITTTITYDATQVHQVGSSLMIGPPSDPPA